MTPFCFCAYDIYDALTIWNVVSNKNPKWQWQWLDRSVLSTMAEWLERQLEEEIEGAAASGQEDVEDGMMNHCHTPSETNSISLSLPSPPDARPILTGKPSTP